MVGSRQETVAKDKQAKVGADWQVQVKRGFSLNVARDLTDQVSKKPLAKDKQEALAELDVAWEILAHDRADQG